MILRSLYNHELSQRTILKQIEENKKDPPSKNADRTYRVGEFLITVLDSEEGGYISKQGLSSFNYDYQISLLSASKNLCNAIIHRKSLRHHRGRIRNRT